MTNCVLRLLAQRRQSFGLSVGGRSCSWCTVVAALDRKLC
jgi:hypothetical protein